MKSIWGFFSNFITSGTLTRICFRYISMRFFIYFSAASSFLVITITSSPALRKCTTFLAPLRSWPESSITTMPFFSNHTTWPRCTYPFKSLSQIPTRSPTSGCTLVLTHCDSHAFTTASRYCNELTTCNVSRYVISYRFHGSVWPGANA